MGEKDVVTHQGECPHWELVVQLEQTQQQLLVPLDTLNTVGRDQYDGLLWSVGFDRELENGAAVADVKVSVLFVEIGIIEELAEILLHLDVSFLLVLVLEVHVLPLCSVL